MNEKMVVVLVCLNGRCCSSECVGIGIVLTEIEAMSVCLFCLFEEMQCNFSGIFKGREIMPEPYWSSKYPIRSLL